MTKFLILAGAVALGLGLGGWLLLRPAPQAATGAEGTPIVQVTPPAQLSQIAMIGKLGFDSVCAACHGPNAAGRAGLGPPLIHAYYRPGHHGDMAFVMAVETGVRAHHWPFGDMPAQKGLTRADIIAITAYVREVQRANGIR